MSEHLFLKSSGGGNTLLWLLMVESYGICKFIG